MALVQLYCQDTSELKLGPGNDPLLNEDGTHREAVISFHNHFASFDPERDPVLADWRKWVAHPGTPTVEILEEGTAMVAADAPGAVVCELCDPPRYFANEGARRFHLKSHAAKGK